MSDDKSNVSDKASEIARNIWLAGLGAYGKAFDDAQNRIDRATKEPPRLFKDLVAKGARLEDEVRDSLANIRQSGTSSVEERINRVRESFNFNIKGGNDELVEINAKLDKLTRKVDALAKALRAGQPTGKARSKRAVGKSAAGKTTSRKARS